MRDARRALDQRCQLAAGTAAGVRLERVAAREHERDDCADEVLAEGERAGHREERNRIDADVAAEQGLEHRPAERDEQRRCDEAPEGVARVAVAEWVEQATDRDACYGRYGRHAGVAREPEQATGRHER